MSERPVDVEASLRGAAFDPAMAGCARGAEAG